MKSKIFYTSWGYDMTHNDYVIVLSETPKSCMVQVIGAKMLSGGGYTGEEIPNPEVKFGEPFRLLKREDHLRGSYPYCFPNGTMKDKRRDSFREWEGRPNHYNTVD